MLIVAAATPGFNRIRFEGNRHIPGRTLGPVAMVKTKVLVSESELNRDAEELARFYHEQGFLDAAVTWRRDSTARAKTLVFQVHEGERARIGAIEVSGNRTYSSPDLTYLLDVRRRDFLILPEENAARTRLLDFYHNHGFYFARCTLITVRESGPPATGTTVAPIQVDLEFRVNEGPVCYFRRLQVRGNRQIKRTLIRRYTGIRHGARFSQTQLVTAQHRLYGSRLFERVYLTVMPADSADTVTAHVLQRATDSLDVRVDIVELSPRSVGFGIGLQLPPWRGLLSAEWEHLNVAGEGHDFRIAGDYSPVAGREFLHDYLADFDVTYRIPYVTRWAINFATHPYGKWTAEKQLRQLELGAETGMSHDFLPTLTASLLNRLHRVVRYDTVVAPVSAITNLLGASLTWDTRNDLFNPASGFYLAPTLEVAGGVLGGSNSFYRARLETRFFRRLLFGHILALRAIGGYVLPYGRSNYVPEYEEFYLGGTNSVRGYNEKSIGPVIDPADSSRYGDVMLNTNVELRSPFLLLHNSVAKGLGAVIFQDGGLVRSRTGVSIWNRYQLAVGVGIRLNTVIGPIRLDYGKRLTAPPKGDWGKIHFAILNLF